jgi:hypothetical protein
MPCTTEPTIHQCNSSSPLITPTIKRKVNGVLVDDDDSSTSSTVTAVNSSCLQQSRETGVLICISKDEKSGFSKKEKNNVCFDESRNISYSNTQMCREECKRLWCSAQEFLCFREATTGIAKQVARFEEKNTSEHSYRRVMERTYESCCQGMIEPSTNDGISVTVLTPGGEQALEQWLDCATTRLGLEKRAVRFIANDRYARRKKITKTVLRIQDACDASSYTQPERKAELLRLSSQAISRPSRLFAEVMARSLGAVVRASNADGNVN